MFSKERTQDVSLQLVDSLIDASTMAVDCLTKGFEVVSTQAVGRELRLKLHSSAVPRVSKSLFLVPRNSDRTFETISFDVTYQGYFETIPPIVHVHSNDSRFRLYLVGDIESVLQCCKDSIFESTATLKSVNSNTELEKLVEFTVSELPGKSISLTANFDFHELPLGRRVVDVRNPDQDLRLRFHLELHKGD